MTAITETLKQLRSVNQSLREELEQKQFLLDAFHAVENSICIYDPDGRLLYGNRAFFESTPADRTDTVRSYPIKDAAGKLAGSIEIIPTRRQSLSIVQKKMGLTAEYTFDSILGSGERIRSVKAQAAEYAKSPYSLLIIGESGVGKELFSQAVHNASRRSCGPFVAVNCANFPENLIESELFGYVEGAFTGASKNGQIGKFELADGGTLFLDEIGELPYPFQAKLLRVLETQQVTRIGSSSPTPINVRVIAATNRDPEKMITEGQFRKDLYYRLQVLNIEIPPLRERPEDIPTIAEAFLRQNAKLSGEEVKVLSPDAQACLLRYDWPGNVRELKNVLQRVTLLCQTSVITREALETAIFSKGYAFRSDPTPAAAASHAVVPADLSGTAGLPHGSADKPTRSEDRLTQCRADVDTAYRALLAEALRVSGGKKKKAAEILGVSRQTLYRMLEKYQF